MLVISSMKLQINSKSIVFNVFNVCILMKNVRERERERFILQQEIC